MSRNAANLEGGDLDRILGYLAAQAALGLQQTYDASGGSATGLHRVEYTILMLVKANPGCTAAVLARALGVSSPNMALWLDRLGEKGLLSRRQSATDRRANHLHLTREGNELAKRATSAILAAEDAALASLSSGERLMLCELLRKVAARPA